MVAIGGQSVSLAAEIERLEATVPGPTCDILGLSPAATRPTEDPGTPQAPEAPRRLSETPIRVGRRCAAGLLVQGLAGGLRITVDPPEVTLEMGRSPLEFGDGPFQVRHAAVVRQSLTRTCDRL